MHKATDVVSNDERVIRIANRVRLHKLAHNLLQLNDRTNPDELFKKIQPSQELIDKVLHIEQKECRFLEGLFELLKKSPDLIAGARFLPAINMVFQIVSEQQHGRSETIAEDMEERQGLISDLLFAIRFWAVLRNSMNGNSDAKKCMSELFTIGIAWELAQAGEQIPEEIKEMTRYPVLKQLLAISMLIARLREKIEESPILARWLKTSAAAERDAMTGDEIKILLDKYPDPRVLIDKILKGT